MMSFHAVHTLTGCLLNVEASADLVGWGRPPLLLLVQDRPAPTAPLGTRRQMRAVHLPLNDTRMGRYRAGLADLLPDLAAALDINQPVADPTPGLRLLAWALCYEDVLVESDDLHEIRRVDAVDADRRGYRITRLRGEPHPRGPRRRPRRPRRSGHSRRTGASRPNHQQARSNHADGLLTAADATWANVGPDLARAPHTVPYGTTQGDDLTFIEREASIS
ncbi:hypothetical protein [Micromonospora zamorensis]|uniref:Uncharacterized protein n=1 Tax=Micromonospora zamorensis TaxID=709883 RepID=A0ABZ1PIK0_9ACTN